MKGARAHVRRQTAHLRHLWTPDKLLRVLSRETGVNVTVNTAGNYLATRMLLNIKKCLTLMMTHLWKLVLNLFALYVETSIHD